MKSIDLVPLVPHYQFAYNQEGLLLLVQNSAFGNQKLPFVVRDGGGVTIGGVRE